MRSNKKAGVRGGCGKALPSRGKRRLALDGKIVCEECY